MLGPAKDERRTPVTDHRGEVAGHPFVGFDMPEMVGDLTTIGLGDLHVVTDRVVLIVTDQAVDRAFERGREQQGLTRRARQVNELANSREKPHVGHPVGLVDHDHVHP